jgi:hypothetical protein
MCASNESENCAKDESWSTGLMFPQSARSVMCGVAGGVVTGRTGARTGVRGDFLGFCRRFERLFGEGTVCLHIKGCGEGAHCVSDTAAMGGKNANACGFSVDVTPVGDGPSPVMQPRKATFVYLCAGCAIFCRERVHVGSTRVVYRHKKKSSGKIPSIDVA